MLDKDSSDILHQALCTSAFVSKESIADCFFETSGQRLRYSREEIEQLAEQKLNEVFPELSARFTELFAGLNKGYFCGRLPAYSVEVAYVAAVVIDPWTGERRRERGYIRSVFDHKIRLEFDDIDIVMHSCLLDAMTE